jgi:hypothetical protein
MAEETTQDTTESVVKNPLTCPITWDNLRTLVLDDVDLRYPYITKKYKNYYMYNGDRSVELKKTDEKWRSNLKSPITNMFQNRLHNMVLNADKRYVSSYRGKKYTEEQAQQITTEMVEWSDYIFSKDDTKSALNGAIFD